MNEQNEFIKNYLHTEYVGCLKTDHEKCIDLQYEEIGNFVQNAGMFGDFFFPCFGAQNIEYCFGIVFSHRFSPRAIWPEFKLLYHKKTAGASVNFYDILTFVLLRYSKNFDSNRRILKENDGN